MSPLQIFKIPVVRRNRLIAQFSQTFNHRHRQWIIIQCYTIMFWLLTSLVYIYHCDCEINLVTRLIRHKRIGCSLPSNFFKSYAYGLRFCRLFLLVFPVTANFVPSTLQNSRLSPSRSYQTRKQR